MNEAMNNLSIFLFFFFSSFLLLWECNIGTKTEIKIKITTPEKKKKCKVGITPMQSNLCALQLALILLHCDSVQHNCYKL